MTNKTCYLLVYDHKHGADYRLHLSYDGAKKAGAKIMRDTCFEWGEDVSSLSDDGLWTNWPSIAGDTEFFSIEEISLEE